MEAYIKAISYYLPEKVVTNEQLVEEFPEWSVDKIAKKVGINERHIAADDETAGDMAYKAAEKLIQENGIKRDSIDFVLLCTQSPDYFLPSTSCIIQSRLGLPTKCGAFDFNLGCSGYVYGLALAKGLVEAGLSKHLLLLTSSLYSREIGAEDAATKPVFGDGATATLIESVESEKPLLDAFVFGTDGKGGGSIIQEVGGSRHPWRTEAPEMVEDAHGRHSTADIFMDGQEVMLFTLREVPPMVEKVLHKAGITRKELGYAVFQQPNRFMLDYVQRKCGLQQVPFFNDSARTGNTVSSSIPLGLEQILEEEEPKQLTNVLLAGYGVGLSWAGCMADLSHVLGVS